MPRPPPRAVCAIRWQEGETCEARQDCSTERVNETSLPGNLFRAGLKDPSRLAEGLSDELSRTEHGAVAVGRRRIGWRRDRGRRGRGFVASSGGGAFATTTTARRFAAAIAAVAASALVAEDRVQQAATAALVARVAALVARIAALRSGVAATAVAVTATITTAVTARVAAATRLALQQTAEAAEQVAAAAVAAIVAWIATLVAWIAARRFAGGLAALRGAALRLAGVTTSATIAAQHAVQEFKAEPLGTQAGADDHRTNHHVPFHRATSPHEEGTVCVRASRWAAPSRTTGANLWKEARRVGSHAACPGGTTTHELVLLRGVLSWRAWSRMRAERGWFVRSVATTPVESVLDSFEFVPNVAAALTT